MAELRDVEDLSVPAPEARTDERQSRRARRRWSWKRRILVAVLSLVVIVVLLFAGVIAYFVIQERRSPSGKVFVESSQGRVPLTISGTVVAPPTPSGADVAGMGAAPPTDLVITKIGLHGQIFPMAPSLPPKAQIVGWMYGSAMPGTAGNTVLYAARSGPYAVFERLDELAAGDQITLAAGDTAYVYQVTDVREVDANATDVLLPTKEPTVTLITDAGDWDRSAGHYTKRLVVRGRYVSAHRWSGT